jgi:hypothetical protein
MIKGGIAGGEKVDSFDEVFSEVKGNEQHKAYDADVANSFYNLASDFYEYGWGDSFVSAIVCDAAGRGKIGWVVFRERPLSCAAPLQHFGFRKRGEPHIKAIQNSQNFVAQKLQVGDMDRVLDMGCGIGGPLRGIVAATGANITGLTINQHQVRGSAMGTTLCATGSVWPKHSHLSVAHVLDIPTPRLCPPIPAQVNRAREITAGLSDYMRARCHYVRQDYLNVVGMEEGAYDAAFYMEVRG